MTTYSQLVDDLVAETVRPDKLESIARYVNQTMRELHFRPQTNAPIHYDANRFEDEVIVSAQTPYLWPIPSITRFQGIECIFVEEYGLYVPMRVPSMTRGYTASQRPFPDLYYYRTGASIAISGVTQGNTLKFAWHEFVRNFPYKPVADRIVIFDPQDEVFELAGGGVPTQEQIESETNWMLYRWPETVAEGTRAKTYKSIGDEVRARMSFSSFESMRSSLWNSEPASGNN